MRPVLVLSAALGFAGVAWVAWSETAEPSAAPVSSGLPAAADAAGKTNGPGVLAVSDVVTLEAAPPTPATTSLATNATPTQPAAPDPFRWDSDRKIVDVKAGEVSAHFEFFVTNVSSAEVSINDLQSSCGCTTAKLPSTPYKLAPGAFGKIEVTMDLLGRSGTVVRLVNVLTSVGKRELFLQANVPFAPQNPLGERLLNQQLAKADRQLVFRGDCAKCHLEPAQGKKGEALFTAACGICHLSKQRASLVPDLATLKVDTSPDYWRLWIMYGKHGSMMPAWSQERGGPLSRDQIESLVEYLNRRYPARTLPK